MSPEFSEYLPIIIGGAIAALIAVIVIMRLNRRARVVRGGTLTRDVLDEGAAPAARNQAFIDTKPSAENVAAPPEPEPAPATATAPSASDDLTRIKGLGPKIATLLGEQGVTTFAQIAAWSDADVERVDATLGRFNGRITRDQWVEQAKLLASGEATGFAQKFGQNG